MDENSGRVILKSVPTKMAEEQVAKYINKLAKHSAYDDIIEKIRQTPTVLFKKVSADAGKKIAADLIKLGAIAGFEPFTASSTNTSNARADGKMATGHGGHSQDAIPSSAELTHSTPTWLSRRSIGAIILVLLSSLLLYIYFNAPKPIAKKAVNSNISKKGTAQLSPEVPENKAQKRSQLQINVSTKANPVVAGKKKVIGKSGVIRTGVYIFSSQTPGLSDLDYAKGLSERLPETLNSAPSIELVGRNKIDRVVKQESLTPKQLLIPKVASRVGRQVGADIIVVGQLIKKDREDKKYGESSVAVKAIDVDSAQTLSIGCFQGEKFTSYNNYYNAFAGFVQAASIASTPLSQRGFLALGEFVDGSGREARAQQSHRLPYHLLKKFEGRQDVCIVSQSHLPHLFATLNLSESGQYLDDEGNPSAPPTYTILSGNYTYAPKGDTPFVMELQFEFLGKSTQRLTVEGESWDDGLKNLSAEIDFLIRAKTDMAELKRLRGGKDRLCQEQGPLCEARAHFKRGKELSGIRYGKWPPDLNVSSYADGAGFSAQHLGAGKRSPDGNRQKLSKERKLKNVRNAIDAFESALFLDPDNLEAQLFLAVCYSHPDIGEHQRANDLLHQVAAKSTDDKLKYIAAKALGRAESVTYAPSFAAKLFTPEYYARTYSANAHDLLWKNNKMVKWWNYEPDKLEFTLEAIKKSILAQCENVKWKRQKGGNVEHALRSASSAFKDLTWYVEKNSRIDDYCQEMMAIIRAEYPQQLPFLIVDSDISDSAALLEGLLLCLKEVEAGETEPLYLEKFYPELSRTLRMCAYSDKREYLSGGVQIAKFLETRSPISSYDKVYLAFCHKGLGDMEKAFSVLGQVQAGNTPEIKNAFVENAYKPFRKILSVAQRKINDPQWAEKQKAKKQSRRSIASVVKVPSDRFIQSIAQDGDTLWICANKKQDPNAPTDRYEPIIYRCRPGKADPQALSLPVKIVGMATSIAAKGNTVWIGTDEGLLEVQPERNAFRHLKEEDGLLKPNINSLSLLGNKLYVGLGSGIGYLDIETGRFTGLATTNDVVRVAASPHGLWGITKSEGLQFYTEKTDNKDFQSRWNCSDAFSLTANHQYVVIGKNLRVYRHFGMRNVGSGGLVIYDPKLNRKRLIDSRLAFPGTDVLSLAFAHNQLWVGGRGFLSVVDLSQNKILDHITGRGAVFHAMLPDKDGGMWVSKGHKLYHLGYGSDGFVSK